MYGASPLGDRTQQVNLVHLLQCASIPEIEGSSSSDDEYRATCEKCICYACDAIGDTRACRQEGNAGFARAFCPAFGGMDCCLLVARVYDTNALTYTTIIDGSDMAAAQGEDDLDSFSLQGFGDQPAAVDHAHGAPLSVSCLAAYFVSCSE